MTIELLQCGLRKTRRRLGQGICNFRIGWFANNSISTPHVRSSGPGLFSNAGTVPVGKLGNRNHNFRRIMLGWRLLSLFEQELWLKLSSLGLGLLAHEDYLGGRTRNTLFFGITCCDKLLQAFTMQEAVLDYKTFQHLQEVRERIEEGLVVWTCQAWRLNALAGMTVWGNHHLSKQEPWLKAIKAFFPWSGLAYKRRLSWQEGPEDPSLLPDLLWQATVSFGHARSCLHVGLS